MYALNWLLLMSSVNICGFTAVNSGQKFASLVKLRFLRFRRLSDLVWFGALGLFRLSHPLLRFRHRQVEVW